MPWSDAESIYNFKNWSHPDYQVTIFDKRIKLFRIKVVEVKVR